MVHSEQNGFDNPENISILLILAVKGLFISSESFQLGAELLFTESKGSLLTGLLFRDKFGGFSFLVLIY